MKYRSLILTALTSACVFSPMASSQFLNSIDTSVPKEHIAAITRDVAQWHDESHPSCRFQSLGSVRIVGRDKDSVTEHWTIVACRGERFSYKVLLLPQDDGSISDMVSDIPTKGAANLP